MSVEKKFNLPAYINVPLFLYNDESLERADLLIGAYIYSLHCAGKRIRASNPYFSELLNIEDRSVRRSLERLEKLNYISRVGMGSNRKIIWLFIPDSLILCTDENMPNQDAAVRVESDKNNTNGMYKNPPTRTAASGQPGQLRPPYIKDDIKEKLKDLGDSANTPNTPNTPNLKNDNYRKDTRFMNFYSAYPRKVKPADAYKAFKQVVGNDENILQIILKDLPLRTASNESWQEKQYIPYPASYLRSHEFASEIHNAAEEAEKKKASLEIENKKREAQQELLTQRRREEELKRHKDYRSEGRQFRSIAAALRAGLTQAPQHLSADEINSKGINNLLGA